MEVLTLTGEETGPVKVSRTLYQTFQRTTRNPSTVVTRDGEGRVGVFPERDQKSSYTTTKILLWSSEPRDGKCMVGTPR